MSAIMEAGACLLVAAAVTCAGRAQPARTPLAASAEHTELGTSLEPTDRDDSSPGALGDRGRAGRASVRGGHAGGSADGRPPRRIRAARFTDRRSRAADPPLDVAAALGLFAACLQAGKPVGVAAKISAGLAPPRLAAALWKVIDRLELGLDPRHAWAIPTDTDVLAELVSLARRSSGSGVALAAGAARLADTQRAIAHAEATAAGERAAVAIAGPLGLCFLPAFVCLGIAPILVGLAGRIVGTS